MGHDINASSAGGSLPSADACSREGLIRARRDALRRAGLTQADLARRIGVSRQSVGLVMADHHRSRRVEQAIADAVGVAVNQLFPTDAPAQIPRVDRAGAPSERGRPGGPPQAAATPRPTPAAAAAERGLPANAAYGVEAVLANQLHALARVALLALADGRIGVESPVVRAVAAALRELDGEGTSTGSFAR